MKFKKLGDTNLKVSLICLGTMTWGTQNSERDAFEQMDYAAEKGVNFFDTAEIYSVPPTSDSYGKTEEKGIRCCYHGWPLTACAINRTIYRTWDGNHHNRWVNPHSRLG